MKVHEVKLSSQFFDDVVSGKKRFELRKNDRDYHKGDYLVLNEMKNGLLTGRNVKVLVTYFLDGYDGLLDDYCILGISLVK